MTILRDLTQKAYDDCERAIIRAMSLLDNDRDKFSLSVSIGLNLINHSLDKIDRNGIDELIFDRIVDDIKSRINNLPETSASVFDEIYQAKRGN